jgi:hypothetical protein
MGFQREKFRCLPPRIRMGFAHEAVTNHTDAKSPGHKKLGLN